MRIVIIGSGNVATVLGRKLVHGGHTVVQVYSRDIAHAGPLAAELNAKSAADARDLDHSADLYLVAITDNALEQLSKWLRLDGQLIIHTAGSSSIHVLQGVSSNYGVLYPLQSIRKEINTPDLPILVDGNSALSTQAVFDLACSITGKVRRAGDHERLILHLAAVVINNFSNHLYVLAKDFCAREGADFDALKPLLIETAARLNDHSPEDMQTGPAIRHDEVTMNKHLELLSGYPELKTFYSLFSKSIQQYAEQ